MLYSGIAADRSSPRVDSFLLSMRAFTERNAGNNASLVCACVRACSKVIVRIAIQVQVVSHSFVPLWLKCMARVISGQWRQ